MGFGLDSLASIVRLLGDQRVGAYPDVIPVDASVRDYLERIVARLEGPESDGGSLTFTLVLFEASKAHDTSRGLLASEGFSDKSIAAIRSAGAAYARAADLAETPSGEAAVYMRILRQMGEVHAAKQRLGVDPDVELPFTIEGAYQVYASLHEPLPVSGASSASATAARSRISSRCARSGRRSRRRRSTAPTTTSRGRPRIRRARGPGPQRGSALRPLSRALRALRAGRLDEVRPGFGLLRRLRGGPRLRRRVRRLRHRESGSGGDPARGLALPAGAAGLPLRPHALAGADDGARAPRWGERLPRDHATDRRARRELAPRRRLDRAERRGLEDDRRLSPRARRRARPHVHGLRRRQGHGRAREEPLRPAKDSATCLPASSPVSPSSEMGRARARRPRRPLGRRVRDGRLRHRRQPAHGA